VRPVPELGYCLVFTPSSPRLYTLNPSAWLLLELCRGQDCDTLEAEFRAALAEQDPFATHLPDAQPILRDLEAKGILVRQPGEEQEP
jgi:hypothetical protein